MQNKVGFCHYFFCVLFCSVRVSPRECLPSPIAFNCWVHRVSIHNWTLLKMHFKTCRHIMRVALLASFYLNYSSASIEFFAAREKKVNTENECALHLLHGERGRKNTIKKQLNAHPNSFTVYLCTIQISLSVFFLFESHFSCWKNAHTNIFPAKKPDGFNLFNEPLEILNDWQFFLLVFALDKTKKKHGKNLWMHRQSRMCALF